MDVNNIVARLYAWPRISVLAEKAIQKSGSRLGSDEGATTLVPQAFTDTTDKWQCHQYILISLEHLPKTSHGLVFGHDMRSDVVLPKTSNISKFHFSISFDEQRRLIVKDLNSTGGTQVTYDGKGKGEGIRRKFQWLIGGVDTLSNGPIVIRVGAALSFHLVPEKYDMVKRETMAKIDAFRQGSMANETSYDLDTVIKTRLATPRPKNLPDSAPEGKLRNLYIKKFLGKGANGMATYRWNVSTGEETVVKKPLHVLDDFHIALWGREADIMEKLRHENILRLLSAKKSPKPQLLLEYCPGGSLQDIAHQLSVSEMLQVLQQSLAGLTYLHGRRIIHRDVKHCNILVASRNPLKIKIADFGLSKHGSRLRTYCGTSKFMAPEILTVRNAKGIEGVGSYNASVDVWALGIVLFELLFGWSFRTPSSDDGNDTIVSRLNSYLKRHRGTIAEFVARYMLQPNETDRATAARCHALAMDLPPPNDRIQNRRSWHFAPLYSNTNGRDNLNAVPAFQGASKGHANNLLTSLKSRINDGGYNDASSTFSRSGDDHASQPPINTSPQANDSGLGDSVSTFSRSHTGHGSQDMAFPGAHINDSHHTGAVPTPYGAVHGYMHWWTDRYPMDWAQGNMQPQIRKRTADESESLRFDSQSRKRRHSSEQTVEDWYAAACEAEDDTVMRDSSP